MRPMDEDERIKEAFMYMLDQSCAVYNNEAGQVKYDHMCLSAYENALALAIEFGWIEESQLTRKL